MRTRDHVSRERQNDERRRDVNAFVNVKNWRIEKRYSLLD